MFLFVLCLNYLLGNISFGLVSAKIFKLQDPRTFGSKNIGATNILRSGNKSAAIFTLLGDFLKGYIAVCLAIYLQHIFNLDVHVIIYSGLCVFIGHVYPVLLKFKGGKGVAAAAGVLLALNTIIGLIALMAWLLTAVIFRYSSLAAVFASISVMLTSLIVYKFSLDFYIILSMVLILLYKHKSNISNLINGLEPKIGKNTH